MIVNFATFHTCLTQLEVAQHRHLVELRGSDACAVKSELLSIYHPHLGGWLPCNHGCQLLLLLSQSAEGTNVC